MSPAPAEGSQEARGVLVELKLSLGRLACEKAPPRIPFHGGRAKRSDSCCEGTCMPAASSWMATSTLGLMETARPVGSAGIAGASGGERIGDEGLADLRPWGMSEGFT